MTRFLTVLAAGSAVAVATVAAPTAADARCRGCGVAAGVIGGLAVGAAIASRPYYYGSDYYAYDYAPGYAYAPAYAYDGPYYGGYYGYRGYYGPRYGWATSDYYHRSRQLTGTR